MKLFVATSAALLLLAGQALAQTPPAPSDEPPPPPQDGGHMMHHDQPEDSGRMMHHEQPEGPKSARFRLRVGDITLGLTCPETEPLKACADLAMQLLDKADNLARHAAPPPRD